MEWSLLDFSVSSLPLDLLIVFNIACICSIMFLLKIVGLFVGGDSLGTVQDGHFNDFDFSKDDGHIDSGEAFDIFTIQSAMAFGMVFGWATLAARMEYNLGTAPSFAVGTVLGVVAALFSAYTMKITAKMNTKPVQNVQVPVGTEGVVYLKIPAQGKEGGIVELVVNNQQHQVKAKTNGEEIPSFSKVKVVANSPEVVVELIK